MAASPHGPSVPRPKPPMNPLAPAKPIPSTSTASPSSSCTPASTRTPRDRRVRVALVVVVAEHANHRDADRGQLLREHPRLVLEPVVREVPAEQEHVRGGARLREDRRELTGGGLATMKIPDGSDAHGHGPDEARPAPDRSTATGHTRCVERTGASLGPKVVIESTGAEPPSYARGLEALERERRAVSRRRCGRDRRVLRHPPLHEGSRPLRLRGRRGASARGAHGRRLSHGGDLSRTGSRRRTRTGTSSTSSSTRATARCRWTGSGSTTRCRRRCSACPSPSAPSKRRSGRRRFVMERERFDGADVAHLLLACASTLNWQRLLRRFGAPFARPLRAPRAVRLRVPGRDGPDPPVGDGRALRARAGRRERPTRASAGERCCRASNTCRT